MAKLREWVIRLWETLRPGRSDQDLEEELRLHRELAEEHARRGAESPEQAARAARSARIRAGGTVQAMEALRDQHSVPWLRDLGRDVRYGFRTLRRNPGFGLFAIGTLALGIGPTIAVFTAVDALLLRPLPVEDPERLVFVAPPIDESAVSVATEWTQATRTFPYTFYERLAESDAGFAGVSASTTLPTALAWSDGATRVDIEFVSDEYFQVLGISAALGRLLPTEDPTSAAVLSHRVWTTAFAGRTDVLGAPIRVGGQPFVVAGIAPNGFAGTRAGVEPDLWLHMSAHPAVSGFRGRLPRVDVLARLAPGASSEQAAAAASAVYQGWTQEQAAPQPGPASQLVRVLPGSHGVPSMLRDSFRGLVWLLVLACACLCLIATANLSGLMVARLGARRREMGVRLTLGASRGRVIRQLLVESAVVASIGGCFGLLLALLITRSVPALLPSWAGVDLRVAPTVIAVGVGVSLAAAAFLGALQALLIGRRDIHLRLAERLPLRGAGPRRMSRGLVAGQIALTLPLVVGAILFAETLHHLGLVDTGFATDRLVQVEALPLMFGYSPAQADTYYASVIERLRELPGVADVTASNAGALSGAGVTLPIQTEAGRQPASLAIVGDRYFETLNIPILLGRGFGPEDRAGAPGVVVVNRAFAAGLATNLTSAVGQSLKAPVGNLTWTVVGVAGDTTFNDLRSGATPIVYVPESQFNSPYLLLHVRTTTDPRNMVEIIQQGALAVDRNVPLVDVQSVAARKKVAAQREQMLAVASGAIGWIALLLSAVGLYGLLAYSVVARTGEIGIRTALGARPGQVARMFLREAALLVTVGCVLGIAASLATTETVEAQLFGVVPTDPEVYAFAIGLLVLSAGLAAYVPARRATKVDPLVALRSE